MQEHYSGSRQDCGIERWRNARLVKVYKAIGQWNLIMRVATYRTLTEGPKVARSVYNISSGVRATPKAYMFKQYQVMVIHW